MSRNKQNTKSGWKARDKQYRTEQAARAKTNRTKKTMAILFATLIGVFQ
jgi:hypothetical protein